MGEYTDSSISAPALNLVKNFQKTNSFITSYKKGKYMLLLLKNESTVTLLSDLYALRLLAARKSRKTQEPL